MTIRKAYYYLFYKLYKFWEFASEPKFWSEWKASKSILLLEVFLVCSIFIWYKNCINRYIHVSDNVWDVIIMCGLCGLLTAFNYSVFHHRDKWKRIVAEFDKWDKRKNRIGSWVVTLVVLAIIANLVFAFYVMTTIDWSKYR